MSTQFAELQCRCGTGLASNDVLVKRGNCSSSSSTAPDSSPIMRSRKRLRRAVHSLSGGSRTNDRFPTITDLDSIFIPSVLSNLIQLSKRMLKVLLETVGTGASCWTHSSLLATKIMEVAEVCHKSANLVTTFICHC